MNDKAISLQKFSGLLGLPGLLGLLSALTFAGQIAWADCVPTMSEAQAKAKMNSEIQNLNEALARNDLSAMTTYNQAMVANEQKLQSRRGAALQEYREVTAVVMKDVGPDWRAGLDKAAGRYNQQLAEADRAYIADADAALRNYNETVAGYRKAFAEAAQKIADDYNRAICAG